MNHETMAARRTVSAQTAQLIENKMFITALATAVGDAADTLPILNVAAKACKRHNIILCALAGKGGGPTEQTQSD